MRCMAFKLYLPYSIYKLSIFLAGSVMLTFGVRNKGAPYFWAENVFFVLYMVRLI